MRKKRILPAILAVVLSAALAGCGSRGGGSASGDADTLIVFNYGDENRAKAAAAFTDYFATPEVNAGWCVACNYPATFPATMETQTYKDFVANNESFTYLNAEHAGAFPAVTAQAYIRTALQTLMSSVAGGADVQESLDAAVTYIQEELANE